MRDKAEVVIVGAGIMGLVDRLQPGEGPRHHRRARASTGATSAAARAGATAGGVRAQFSSEENIRLMQESIRICRDFAREMKINVWFRQGGYLFLVRSEAGRRTPGEERRACRTGAASARACSRRGRRSDRPRARRRGRGRRQLQPRGRRGLPLALRLGLRARRAEAGGRDRHLHRGEGLPHHGQAHRRRGHRQGGDPDAPRRQRRRRLEPGGRAAARRRAARTTPTATRFARPSRSSSGSSRWSPTSPTASTSRSRCAARSSAASATRTCRRGSTGSSHGVPRRSTAGRLLRRPVPSWAA